MVAGVEVHHVGGNGVELDPIDVVEDAGRLLVGLVGDDDPGFLPERHRPVAVVAAAVGAGLDGERVDVGPHPVSGPEEVADGGLDRGDGRAVPVDAQDDRPGIADVHRIGDEPDVGDLSGSLEDSDRPALPLLQADGVAVRGELAGRGPGARPLLGPHQVVQVLAGRGSDEDPAHKAARPRSGARRCSGHGHFFFFSISSILLDPGVHVLEGDLPQGQDVGGQVVAGLPRQRIDGQGIRPDADEPEGVLSRGRTRTGRSWPPGAGRR